MRPIKLTMQAFGSYGEKTVIDFTEPVQDLFLITGDTGAGKTTVRRGELVIGKKKRCRAAEPVC